MEKNTTNYKFLNAKDRASERKNSHGILDTDRYHTRLHRMCRPASGSATMRIFHTVCDGFVRTVAPGLLCAIFGGNACP